ncbi:hypothetical protein JOE11_005446 [Robbsia andropogonis]
MDPSETITMSICELDRLKAIQAVSGWLSHLAFGMSA